MTHPTLDEIIEGLELELGSTHSALMGAKVLAQASTRNRLEVKVSRISNALTRLKALKPRPIEEAPKDKPVFISGGQVRYYDQGWRDWDSVTLAKYYGYGLWHDGEQGYAHKPTHFIPLSAIKE